MSGLNELYSAEKYFDTKKNFKNYYKINEENDNKKQKIDEK